MSRPRANSQAGSSRLRREAGERSDGEPRPTALYQDETVVLDDLGLTIKSLRWRGDERRITYGDIEHTEMFEMGLWSGRFRLVGISFGRPRSWFPRGRSRTNKSVAIALDLGRLIHPVIVPDDPLVVNALLGEALAG